MNNQYKYIDPSGHFELTLGSIFGGVVAAVKSVSLAAVIATTGWIAVGVVAIGAVGYGVYSYSKSKKDTKPISPTIPNDTPRGKTTDTDRGGKTQDITGGNPRSNVLPCQPKSPTLKLPQPCPEGFGWNLLPKDVIAAITILGMSEWINELLLKSKVSRRYKKNQTHHIIAENAWSACGSVKHDFYLDDAGTVVTSHFKSVDNIYNYTFVNNGLHRRIHTKKYYQSINLNFPLSLQKDNLSNKGIVRARLLNYNIALEGLSYLAI